MKQGHKGKKLTGLFLPEEMMDEIDKRRGEIGITRQAYITLAIFKTLQEDNSKIYSGIFSNLTPSGVGILQAIIPVDTPEAEAERRRAFGARIKAMRKEIGLTQAEVAHKLGIASQSVTNYEAGKTDPSIRNLISLAAVLGVSTDYLLGRRSSDETQTSDAADD